MDFINLNPVEVGGIMEKMVMKKLVNDTGEMAQEN
jgi:hypothetical protein